MRCHDSFTRLGPWRSASHRRAHVGLALCCLAAQAGAAPTKPGGVPGRDAPPPSTVYRCEGGGTATYSDTPQRCPTGQGVVARPRATASGPTVTGTARLSLPGPPCPLPVKDPEGAVWSPIRACYTRFVQNQPWPLVAEAQLAGAVMGHCDTETTKLAQVRELDDGLGETVADRRQSIKLWAQWLARSLGRSATPCRWTWCAPASRWP